MTSFFRKSVAHKVLSTLSKKQDLKLSSPNILASGVKVNRFKSAEPQLILPWKKIEEMCRQTISFTSSDFVRILRNQGLPTKEGFIDIQLSELPIPSLVFTVDKHIFSRIVLFDIINNEDNLVENSCLFEDIAKKKVIVQCSLQPVGEVCHLTYFRTLIHQNFVANINKVVGHQVLTIAHANDWCPYTAAFVNLYNQLRARGSVLKNDKRHLFEIYKAAVTKYNNDLAFKSTSDSMYEKMKQGDSSTLSDWQNLRDECISHYNSIYQRMNIHFNEFVFDSASYKKSEDIANELSNTILDEDGSKKKFEDLEDNSYIYKIQNFDSALTDLSRYISAVTKMKEKYNFDMMYYIIPSSEKDFISTLSFMMKKLNYSWIDELHQVPLNVVRAFDTKRRKKISIDDILDLIKEKIMLKLHENLQMELNESLEEMAEELSVSSLMINDMKHKRKGDYDFIWEDVISFKKDTAASFQFCSAGLKGLQEDSEYIFTENTDTSALLERQAHYLIQHLARFDEMVFKSYTLLEPYFIFQYLSSLWYFTDQMTNSLKLDIRSNRLKPIKARLLLLSATLKVLNKGLHILGITPLKKVYSQEQNFVQNN